MKVITTMRRRLTVLRVAVILIIITTGLGWSLFSPPLPAKAATTGDILFIHGSSGLQSFGSYNTATGGCLGDPAVSEGTWNTAEAYFHTLGWNGNFKTLGYYRGDWQNGNHCDIQFDSQAPGSNHESSCDGYFYDAGDEGSNNQDLRNLSCQLAWYIFQNYTSQNKNLWVVAHSMGGLIIRDALEQVESHNSAFPPYLYVPEVVTLATPHGGIPSPGGAAIFCVGCTQASNMQPGAGAPSDFINTLLNETFAPIGSPGEPTEWTVMGSSNENWTNGVKADSSLNFPSSSFSYPAVHKIEYTNVPGQSNNPYLHGDYLHDTDSNQDATANTCDNCSFPPSNGATVYHSLLQAFQSLSHSVPAAPTHAVINVPNGGNFATEWLELGGVNGVLGDPISNFYTATISGGQAQDFQHGGIYWSSPTGTNTVHGDIYGEYYTITGGAAGALSYPISEEQGIGTGRVSYFAGQVCGGGFVLPSLHTSGSAIFWTPPTAAHEVQGCIYTEYMKTMSGPTGVLGFPVSDEQATTGGRVSYFVGSNCTGGTHQGTGSAIYWSGSTGAHEVQGCIYQTYKVFGGTGGALGLPLTDELSLANGRVSYFAGQVCGGGGPNGSGSGIFWYPNNEAYEVQGCIYTEYEKTMGGPAGVLGFPVSDEQPITGGRASLFTGSICTYAPYKGTGSAIYWSGSTSAHEVQGCIYQAYKGLGGSGSSLGLPTTDEYAIAGGRESDFQHGYITFSSSTGQVTVHVN